MNKLNRLIILAAVLLTVAASAVAQSIQYLGGTYTIINVEPEKNTGLDQIFVTYGTADTRLVYSPTSSSVQVTWLRYSNMGGGYAEEVTGIERKGNQYILNNPQGDMGYIIEEPGKRTCVWVCDYTAHTLNITGVAAPPLPECASTTLQLTGEGEPLVYFTINGQRRTIDRQIEVRYNNLEWNEEQTQWQQVPVVHNVADFQHEVYLTPAVLCNTIFEVSADRFLREWGMEQNVVSNTFYATAVDQRTDAVQEKRGSDDPDYKSNQMHGDENSLGGSAPAVITFYAYPSDAVRHSEWQISTDPEFNTIDQRFVQQDLEYTFLQEGISYVRYIASNDDGSCESFSDNYTVSIGASDIKCPNAFSPGASEGVNDEWKVSYRSITEFECWIFNRWGQEMFHLTDPEQGWDGRYHGKLVKPGAYYYVIQATGADGKKYKLSGDINIINYRLKQGTSTPEEE